MAEAISLAGIETSRSESALLLSTMVPSLSVVKETEVHDRDGLPSMTLTKPSKSTLHGLLLTDMARELIVQQVNLSTSSKHISSSTGGNFCLAWFAPSGIQITAVSLENEGDESDDEEVDDFKFNFGGDQDGWSASNATDLTGSEINVQQQPRKKLPKKVSNLSQSVSCCHEWRGYRHAMEVLAPLGFATNFVRVRTLVAESIFVNFTSQQINDHILLLHRTFLIYQSDWQLEILFLKPLTTWFLVQQHIVTNQS